ncbi:MAG: S-layer homology domain-containing protein [Oscillospiraceae bacterium]|nr:S-layer homology domain-containing protein [Oscillospiraceae bacterium]
MKAKFKKFLSTLLTLTMILGLFAVMPMTANAANAATLKSTIENFDHGGYGGELTAAVSGNIVTVTGTIVGVTHTLNLNINPGVKVIWKAKYSGSVSASALYCMISVSGQGTFEVAEGGSIKNNGSESAIRLFDKTTINVSGGEVYGFTRAIYGTSTTINVSGGEVHGGNDYPAIEIYSGSGPSTINVSGGKVYGDYAIENLSADFTINVSGGEVYGEYGIANYGIANAGNGSTINMSGGEVHGNYAIINKSEGSIINVSGGEVHGDYAAIFNSPTAQYTTINVSGGVFYGDHTIFNSPPVQYTTINVSGGVFYGDSRAVCNNSINADITVTGGFLFSFGTDLIDSYGVIDNDGGGELVVGGTAVLCAWVGASGDKIYAEGTSEDLTMQPAGAAKWGKSGGLDGIVYANGANTGFFPIGWVTDGVTVSAATPESYTVTFKTDNGQPDAVMTVTAGDKAEWGISPLIKDGYVFGGWYKDAALTQEYDMNTPVTSDLILYAKWTESDTEPDIPVSPGMANFVKIRTYTPGMFSDVNENSWYGFDKDKVVASAYEYGLMQGSGANTFKPTGNITIAEAVTVAARVHSIYTTGEEDFVQGSPWYKVYVDYAVANGIIKSNDFADYTKTATRAQMAYIFSRSVPESEFAALNTVNSLPDVNSGTPYYSSIIMLYKAGILAGNNDAGIFYPNNNITRAEAAAIISRVILPATRIKDRIFG